MQFFSSFIVANAVAADEKPKPTGPLQDGQKKPAQEPLGGGNKKK